MAMNGDHYAYRVRWSGEDEAYVATVAEMPSLLWIADSQVEALLGLQNLIAGVLEDMKESGETPPVPLADRVYSGKFMVRIPPRPTEHLRLRPPNRTCHSTAL